MPIPNELGIDISAWWPGQEDIIQQIVLGLQEVDTVIVDAPPAVEKTVIARSRCVHPGPAYAIHDGHQGPSKPIRRCAHLTAYRYWARQASMHIYRRCFGRFGAVPVVVRMSRPAWSMPILSTARFRNRGSDGRSKLCPGALGPRWHFS